MSRDSRDILSPKGKNVHWQEHEITELLAIRASEGIRNSITGTVKDGVVYSRVSKMLAERGVYRTQVQVISKLKYLKKKYAIYHKQKLRSGKDRVSWPFYEQCHRAFGTCSPVPNAGNVHRRPSPPSVPSPPAHSPPSSEVDEKHHEVVVSLWDEMDDREISEHLEPVEADDDDEEEDQYSPPGQKQPIRTSESHLSSSPWLGSQNSPVNTQRKEAKTSVLKHLDREKNFSLLELKFQCKKIN